MRTIRCQTTLNSVQQPTKMPPIRQWAARGGALALLCGALPCESFLVSHVACEPESGRCSGRSMRPRANLCMSTVTPPLAASATGGVPSTSSAASEETTGGNAGADASTGRRWIKDMKAGEKVIGYVTDTTTFAAFVEVGVVRQGSKVGCIYAYYCLYMWRHLQPQHTRSSETCVFK